MDDMNRQKLNAEISRVHDKLKALSPDTEEYEHVSSKLIKLTELANKDDETKNRVVIERERFEAEANLEALKREAEEKKFQEELKLKEQIEREKLDAEASLEASKRGMESEKFEAEIKLKEQDAKRSWLQFGISCGVTLATFVGTWVFNRISQDHAEYFEATGQAYTSKFSRWLNKEPMHPNPLLRNVK